MKEMLIAFFVVLVVGSIMNGMPKDEDQPIAGGGTTTVNAADNPLVGSATEHTFKEQVLDAPMPVLVEFTDDDAHCKNMAPIISDVATTYQAAIKVVTVDVMNNPSLMQRYQLGLFPGILLFKGGQKVDAVAGELTQQELTDWLKKSLPQLEHGG